MLNRRILFAVMALTVTAPAVPSAAQQATLAPASAVAKHSGVARSNDLAVHYDVHGDLNSGVTPLLILHGAYMSANSMKALVDRFALTRPVIVVDQRGHGRTGDAPGPITYENLAEDAAAVLDAAGVRQADVFGYSMGGSAAIQLAIRHPDRVGKLVAASAGTRLNTMYPEILAGIAQITPEIFNGTPIRTEYERLAPRPQDFPILVEKLKVLDSVDFSWPDADIRAIRAKTMVIAGDYDVVRPEHGVELFRLRGGGDAAMAAAGILAAPPPARLAILPATSHIGVMADPDLVVALTLPFLNDATPPMPEGFF